MPSAFTMKLAKTAEEQYQKYHLFSEGDQPLSGQIKHYWEDLDIHFPGVQEQWSAVFVSWNMLKAGATKSDFKFAQRHAIFMNWAIHNTDHNTGSFRGHPIDAYSPALGDIVVNNQPGNSFTFEHARQHDDYHSHSAIVIERGHDHTGEYVLTVGGNESDSVRQKIIYLKNGLIPQRSHMPFIGVIEDRM